MPPKVKYTRDEIIMAALEMTRTDGIRSVTARALGEKLKVSSRPIFTAFQNMEEVQQEVIRAAKKVYHQYVEEGFTQTPAFKGVGIAYIHFAQRESKLFQLLFMSEQKTAYGISEILPVLDEHYQLIVSSIQSMYLVDETTARKLYRHLWIYSHGIAVLCATKVCDFSEEEYNAMLTEVFVSVLRNIKAGEAK